MLGLARSRSDLAFSGERRRRGGLPLAVPLSHSQANSTGKRAETFPRLVRHGLSHDEARFRRHAEVITSLSLDGQEYETMTTATVTSKGQITIASNVRQSLNVAAGDRVEFVELEPGQFLLMAANRSVIELKGMFGVASKSVSIEDMNQAIASHGASAR